ncbi:YceD family protein [Pelagibius marinus]|uniref:YceD family protein n=1 Tax=Pelagibius marinus TaxID=2762760 RepID=UPI0018721F26|nr:DUF177 domain-containing protein [Pelagibius marinus]
MSGSAAEATNEFSRIVAPDRLGGPAVSESIEATADERDAVARRLGLLSVERLTAQATVKSVGGRLFRVQGHWEAEVQQGCVVTLEPVPQSLAGDLEAAFEPGDGRAAAPDDDVLIDPEAADPAEVLPEEGIDLGELVVQELSVALDPYPRAPGAEIPVQYRPPEVEEKEGPFAALKVLKGDK